MNFYKTILTVLLLTAFSIPLLSPFLLQVKQLYVQWEMLEALEKQELVEVRLKTSDIEWIKHDKECEIDGEMFDVKKIKIINDETVLTGLYDYKEKEIKRSLKHHANNQQQSDKLQQLVKLFSVMVSTTAAGKLSPPASVEINDNPLYRNSIYTNPYPDFTSPPPKIG